MNVLRTVSLTDTLALIVIVCVALLTLLVTLAGLRSSRTRRATLIALIIAVVLTVFAWLVVAVVWKPFPDSVSPFVYGACGLALFVICSAVLQRGRRILLAILAVVSLLNAAATANLIYQQYPTLGSLSAEPTSVAMTYEDFSLATQPPRLNNREVGALVTVPLSGTSDRANSGFPARDAIAYIPPAYWTQPSLPLPVLVLLAGNPGEPSQWFGAGQASQTADDYQATHGGVSPVVVSVDATGSLTGNPGCVDGPELNVMTYLSQDVPVLLRDRFRVNPDQRSWTIGGLSYGGTCAFQVVTNHPEAYGSFLNFSGQAEPSVGSRQETLDRLFNGDAQAFKKVNPADLLTEAITSGDNRYTHLAGQFIAGESDKGVIDALTHLNTLANQAGMSTTFGTVPGGHSFQVWRVALADTFDWAAQRGGLTSTTP